MHQKFPSLSLIDKPADIYHLCKTRHGARKINKIQKIWLKSNSESDVYTSLCELIRWASPCRGLHIIYILGIFPDVVKTTL